MANLRAKLNVPIKNVPMNFLDYKSKQICNYFKSQPNPNEPKTTTTISLAQFSAHSPPLSLTLQLTHTQPHMHPEALSRSPLLFFSLCLSVREPSLSAPSSSVQLLLPQNRNSYKLCRRRRCSWLRLQHRQQRRSFVRLMTSLFLF